jgi:hypothetical protein
MDNTALNRKRIGEFIYEAFYDPDDSVNRGETDIEFDTIEEKQEFLRKFETAELTSYGVIQSKVCECCCMWSEVSSVWGMHCADSEQAIDEFIAEYSEA